MQQHIYIAKRSKIISQSFFVWIFLLVHVVINIFLVHSFWKSDQLWKLLLVNLILSSISIPSLIIFTRYYKYSIKKQFIVAYNTLKLIDLKTNDSVEIVNQEIESVSIISTSKYNYTPWTFYEYFTITDKNGKNIIITSFFLEPGEFWSDTLTRKVKNPGVKFINSEYPVFKIN